jgi:NAD(P)H-flavin reductase
MNGKKIKPMRKEFSCKIDERNLINENLMLLKIEGNNDMAEELKSPGTYVFLRNYDDVNYYDSPMSVMDICENKIIIVYQIKGNKTKRLSQGDKVIIRGPYWNGILGVKSLNKIYNSNCLIAARGIGQSSVVLVTKFLSERNNKIYLLIDKGNINSIYIKEYIDKLNNVEIIEKNLMENEGEKSIDEIFSRDHIALVFSAGSDILHQRVSDIIKKCPKDLNFMVTNNNILCCGEGICGSCVKRLNSGYKVRACKTSINPKEIFK